MKAADVNLFDLWMNNRFKSPFDPPEAVMLKAKRFVLDASASEFIGQLLGRAPLEVLRHHQFARPPYETTWIEMDHEAYFQVAHDDRSPIEARDLRYGILVRGDQVWIMISGANGDSTTSPIMFDLHRPVSFDEELELAQRFDTSRLTLRMAMLGGVETVMSPWWHSAEAADICRSHRMKVAPMLDGAEPQAMGELLQSGTGNLKLILTMILMLVRPHNSFVLSEAGPKRVLLKGKSVALKPHHVLKLRLEHEDPVARYLSHEHTGKMRRLHDVRGHWAQHRKRGLGCSHQWQVLSPTQFQCANCGAKRWWKADHHRGADALGSVTKEYDVTR